MASERAQKRKKKSKLPESSGQSQATAEIDHAFAGTDTGKKPSRLPRLTPKQWMIIIAGIAILIIGAGLAIWQNESEPEKPKPAYSSEGIKLEKLNDEQLQDELQKLIFQKKFKSAEELINYQDDANSNKHRMLLAVTYLNQNNLKDGLRILLDLERRDESNWQLTKMIGGVYQQLGDKQNALAYYKKALNLLKKTGDSPVQADEVHFLEQTIKTVEGQ